MFAISPKLDCPHVEHLNKSNVLNYFVMKSILDSCQICFNEIENWLCLQCLHSFCSRYINGHMSQHNEESGHSLAISYSDGSIWCYSCDSYIDCIDLVPIRKALASVKFPEEKNISNNGLTSIKEEEYDDDDDDDDMIENDTNDQVMFDMKSEVIAVIDNLIVEEDIIINDITDQLMNTAMVSFSYNDLVYGLNNKIYKRIVFLTGAGISVAAGIPDFRTPNTGIYSKLEEFNLPYPEAIFQIDYLQSNPIAFYKIANGFLTYKAKPVYAHKFIKKCYDNDILLMNYTQNIDGLELDVGIPLSHLIQAHGHMRGAHCYQCNSNISIDLFFEYVQKEEVLYCKYCPNNSGIIKPNIIFFGENLPSIFYENINLIKSADLIFIMGTSLQVYPFTSLLNLIYDDEKLNITTPIVVFNHELPTSLNHIEQQHNNRLLFISGDIEENISKLANVIHWTL